MTTPIDTHKLARSLSAGRKTPHEDIYSPSPTDDKYSRLEALLRQTLSLAGEIAENASGQRPSRISATGAAHDHPGECIVLRKTSRTASEPALGFRRQSSASRRGARRKPLPSEDSEQQDSATSASAASSMQEPFSPGSLAMSLDAIVEGKRSDIPLVDNSNFVADRLPEPSPLTRATTSSPRCPTPGSTLGLDSMSQSATSAPIPIPGPPRRRPSTGHRTSSQGRRGSGDEVPSPTPQWHVRIVPVLLNRDPVLSSSPPRTPAMPEMVKLEAVFPYRFFSDGHAAARWSGEGSYIIIGRSPLEDDGQSPQNLDECEYEFGPATETSLRDFVEVWEGTVDEQGGCDEH